MSAGSNICTGRTSPTLTQVCLDMKALPGSISALSENKDSCVPLKDGLRLQRKNKNRINPISHRKTRINSISKQTLTTIRPGPAVPPPYDMTTDCVIANHFLPPAKICADDEDQDLSSDASEEQFMNSKACAFCNRGMETRMMQGNLVRYDPTPGFDPFHLHYEQSPRSKIPDIHEEPTLTVRRGPGRPPFKGRKKGTILNGFSVINSNPKLPLDMILFGTPQERDIEELFEATGHTWCHSCCAVWSEGVQQNETSVENVDKAVFQAMTQKCEHCNNYGASVACNDESCTKKFHYTCASSAGCFQEVKSKTVLCTDHIDQVEELVGEDANCAVCDEIGDLTKQLFCCNCWRHYHGKCLQPKVDVLPSSRMAWHCPACKICTDCGSSGDDSKMLVCDICDKGYHMYCLKPPVVTLPKDGWKCESCRRCQDCGSSTPGSGATSRWHFNYTICDSCYQQRNKGLSCPLCGRAYRHFSDIPMIQCKKCEKCVHRECDQAHANMVPYRCPNCRVPYKHESTINSDGENTTMLSSNQLPGNEDMLSSISDPNLSLDINININLDECNALDDSYDLGGKLPFDEEMEVELKEDEFSNTPQFSDSLPISTLPIAKKTTVSAGKQAGKRRWSRRPRPGGGAGRKRGKTGKPGSKPKNKAIPPQSLPDKENMPDVANNQEDPSKHPGESLKSCLVLFSTDDHRMKTQDMCRCCGSFGQGVEGHLIPCSQCGQCYHPYCVNVKINKVIITKGWRCLDCTLCEGCGKGSDEARLLLCDSCDISYHTYCLDPPLDHVPHGGWKCKWCVVCTLCSRTTPGKSCKWMSNYTLCGPCASLTTCPICKTLYKVDDLMIQCVECERWLHAYCDQFTKEEDVERAADAGYKCYFCRPKSQSFFSITSTSTVTTASRWGQSVNTLSCVSSYAFGTFGPSSPKATSVQHYHPGPDRKPLHPVQRYGSKGTVEMSLASRIALGNTGESCSPAAIFLTENGEKHISESKRHHNKANKKRRNKMKKVDQVGGKNVGSSVERSSLQTARITGLENHHGGEKDSWLVRPPFAKKPVTKRRDVTNVIGSTTGSKDDQLQKVQENFFGPNLLMSASTISENIPRSQDPTPINVAQNEITEPVREPVNSVSWSLAPHPSVTPAPPVQDTIETLPAAPDLNLPDPDVLVNQLGMLVTAAEGESMRNEPCTNQDARLPADTRTDYTGGSAVSSSSSHSQESVHSLNTEQRRQPSHDLDILVPQSGDLPMVDSQDIEDFFSGIENELSQRPTGLISDPLLSSVGVHVTPNPVPQRPPPPPYSSAARVHYPRDIHSHPWGAVSVGEPPPYQAPHQERVQTNIEMVHSAANGARVEPEFEHINDDFGPRRPRPESPRADSHKQLLKWQEDEKLGAMATISPVLYANLNYPNLRDEYPEWVPRYRAMARLWRKLRTDEREPYRHKARDNRVKLKDQMKRNGASKLASVKESDILSNTTQLTSEPQVPVVNGLPIEHQTGLSSKVENETPYPGMAPSNHLANNNPHVNNPDKSQTMQSTQQHNAQYSFPKHPFQQNESVMNMAVSQPVAENQLMSSQGSHILTNDVSKKERNQKKYRGDRDKEKELKDKKNQIWQEREREWKLLQQQRQQENRKQQQQNQDNYPMRKDIRGKQSKTPDWRKTSPQNDNANNLVTEQHSQTVAASTNDNTLQIQLSNYISSSQPSRVDEQLQHTSIMSVPQAERAIENSQSTPSFQIQTVAVTTSTTSVENSTTFWTQDTPRDSGSSVHRTPSRTMSTEGQHQNWMGQQDAQQHTQHSMQLSRQMSDHELQREQHQPGQQDQSSFQQHQPALPLNVVQVPASTLNTPISSEHEPHRPMSRDPSVHQSVTQHLAMTRPELSATQSKQSENTFLEQTPRSKQQETLTQKQQQVQQLQKQQQLQQQEVLQREQRKQLVLAQHQQQGLIQMQLKHHRFPPQQPYPTPQPPRQANQFTANSKEMPEIDTEEEHQERLQFLYRQRQMQKQLQARQYMMQPPAPAPSSMWVNNPQVMQGLQQGLPQNVPSDPLQQRLFLEQQRASQRLDLQRGNMEKLPHHVSNPYNTTQTPHVDPTQKFVFHQQTKNGQNDSEFLTTSQVTHTQVNISTYSTQASVTGQTTTAAIFSEIASAKSDSRKSARKDRRNSTIDLSTHSGQYGAGFPNAIETEPQRDGGAVNHSGNNKNEMLAVGQETCITVDEGNVRRIDTADPGFAADNDNRREQEEQSAGDDLNGKSLVLPYGTPNPGLQNNPANPQLVVPPPQLPLSPQQQHMLLQAQQQQLLWQQAHSQLQHQYQLLYQQLQQLQIQLQQTQDPALHQRVLRQQQQLRFLQTQILTHWQQGQMVVQQIHLQALGLNAMFNQMDPTQQKHMQMYQQELVRQQQQWAQQFSGVGVTIPGIPQDNRPPPEEKPKRSRRSRAKTKNPPKETQQTGANTPEANTGSVPSTEATSLPLSAVSQNVKENEESSKDQQQERHSEAFFRTTEQQAHQLHHQEGLQRNSPQQLDHQQILEQEHQQQLSHQPEQQRRSTMHEQQHTGQQLEPQSQQEQIQLIQQQQHIQQQLLQQEQHSQQQQVPQQRQQPQLVQHQPQHQQAHQQQQQQQQSQPSLVEQQQLRQQQNRQSYQDMYNQQQQTRQAEQPQLHQGQPQYAQQLVEQPTQPVVDRLQLQLQHQPYETQHRSQPTTTQQQTLTAFQQQQGSRERQPYRTHGEISSAVSHSDVSREHPQAVLGRRPIEDCRPKMERRASVGSFRPEHHASLQSPISEVPQRNLLSNSATVPTSQSKINISSSDTATKEAEDKNQAPKALEKLEMMVAVMDVEAKRTEAETARRAEDLQNEEFLSETLGVVNISTNETVQISYSLPNDVVAAGNYSVKQGLLTNIHKSTQPEALKNELVQNNHVMDEKIPEGMHFKDGPELNSQKGSAVTNELIANTECKGPGSKNNHSSGPEIKDEVQKQENLEITNAEVKNKDQDEQLRMKRQLQIEERDRKLSDRKRVKSLHSDRKQNKKETARNRTAKSKKFKLTDEAIVQSLKELPPLQLCEPEFLMPSLIIQPTLNGLYHGQTVFRGSFGRSYITDVDDYYANKKFPDIKVCIDNPPTPPTSLPPSPTFTHSKEQRLYDMLVERTQHSTSMFPTPPYGGDSGVDVKNPLPKEKPVDRSQRQKLSMIQDHSRTLGSHLGLQNAQHEVYPAFVIDKGLSVRSKPENSLQNDSDVNKIYSDVNVTLTIAAISDETVHETVNAISELIDVDKPTKLTIEPPVRTAVYLETNERIGNSRFVIGNSIDERIVSGDTDVKKNQSGNGPYCRHCDVVILGIGVVRNNSTNGTKEGLNDDKTSNYRNINIEDEVNDGRDIFCSSACLKQYYSLDLSETSSVSKESSSTATTPEEELKTKGLTTSYKLVNENDGSMAVRGDEVAEETLRVSLGKSQQKSLDEQNEVEEKRSKRSQWRRWKDAPSTPGKANELTDDEIFQLLVKHGMAKEAPAYEKDRRHCVLCSRSGDGETNGTGRLLNVDLDAWVHLNCALWSYEVYETQNGALMNVGDAIKRGEKTECVVCRGKGATILCNKALGPCLANCSSYHFQCARDNGCLFFKDKTVRCPKHQSDCLEENVLPSHAVFRKVFVNRQEIEQIAKMLSCNQTSEKPYSFRIGNLILNSIGQLLPHQVQAFHTRDSVYPVGFSTTRIYWSMRVVGRRCRYQCQVKDVNGDPHFVVKVEEEGYDEVSFDARTPRDAWLKILEPVESHRKNTNRVNLFPGYITGEDLFGLSEPLIVRIVESMPGVDQMQGYNMRYGRSPIMELPLAINPSGCARSEPLLRTHFKRPGRARRSTKNASSATTVVVPPEELNSSVYSKQFAHSKTQQYRKLKSEWRSNVLLGRSRIQGLGLFANRDLEGNNMVIEYIGSIIRNEVANKRERIYESQNHGVYMFRIDNDSVIDATIAGGPARYINHSCQPNCVAEVVRFEREQKIIIISNRRIEKGEELTYDYKFDFEDDQHKIPCLCGAVNCRKWMN